MDNTAVTEEVDVGGGGGGGGGEWGVVGKETGKEREELKSSKWKILQFQQDLGVFLLLWL